MLLEIRRWCVCRHEPFLTRLLRSRQTSFWGHSFNAHTQAGHEWSWLLEHPIASLPLCSDVPSYQPGHLTLKCCCLWCGDLFVRCTVAALRGQSLLKRAGKPRCGRAVRRVLHTSNTVISHCNFIKRKCFVFFRHVFCVELKISASLENWGLKGDGKKVTSSNCGHFPWSVPG